MVEGDGDGLGIGEIGIIVGESSDSTEVAEVVEAENFGAAGAHGVVEGTDG
jgi:hypothetical protein